MNNEFTYFIIKIDTVSDSHIIQKLLFKYDIDWKLDTIEESTELFDDYDCYYAINLDRKELNYVSIESDIKSTIYYRLGNKKIYHIDDISIINTIILHGCVIPSYKPKKIERTL